MNLDRILTIKKTTMFVAAALLLFAIGCGDGRGTRVPVSGTVTINGSPLTTGSVTFLPEAGSVNSRAGAGTLDSDGRFRVTSYKAFDGLLRGKYSVIITSSEEIGPTTYLWHAPRQYSLPGQSNLTAEIESETDELKFALTWETDPDHSAPYEEKQ